MQATAELGGLRASSSASSLPYGSCGSPPSYPLAAGDLLRHPPPPCTDSDGPRSSRYRWVDTTSCWYRKWRKRSTDRTTGTALVLSEFGLGKGNRSVGFQIEDWESEACESEGLVGVRRVWKVKWKWRVYIAGSKVGAMGKWDESGPGSAQICRNATSLNLKVREKVTLAAQVTLRWAGSQGSTGVKRCRFVRSIYQWPTAWLISLWPKKLNRINGA